MKQVLMWLIIYILQYQDIKRIIIRDCDDYIHHVIEI